MRSLVIVVALAAAFTLSGCGEQRVRPPNTAVFSPAASHGISDTDSAGSTLRQCPPTALNC
jgi:hypothetical protein